MFAPCHGILSSDLQLLQQISRELTGHSRETASNSLIDHSLETPCSFIVFRISVFRLPVKYCSSSWYSSGYMRFPMLWSVYFTVISPVLFFLRIGCISDLQYALCGKCRLRAFNILSATALSQKLRAWWYCRLISYWYCYGVLRQKLFRSHAAQICNRRG